MYSRTIILASSGLLGIALLVTMVYAMGRLLVGTVTDSAPSATTDVPVATQAVPFASALDSSSLGPADSVPADGPTPSDGATALSSTTNDGSPPASSVSAGAAVTSGAPRPPDTNVDRSSGPGGAVIPATAPPSTSSISPSPSVPAATPRPTTAESATTSGVQPTLVPVAPTVAPTATLVARLTAGSRGVESVKYVKQVDGGSFIVFAGQDLWVVDYDAACFDSAPSIGGSVLIYSPGGFPDGAASIVLPDRPRDCKITGVSPLPG